MMKEKLKNFISKNRKIMIVGIVALLVVIVVAILSSGILYESIDDSYFISNKDKLVVSIDESISNYEPTDYESDVTHVVYYIDGDVIKNVRIFYDYKNEEEARYANEHIVMDDKNWVSGRKLNGKYIIFNVKKELWENLTPREVKNIIDEMRTEKGWVEMDKNAINQDKNETTQTIFIDDTTE